MRMNSPQGKAILAMVRDGDYAHPGEEQAISLVFDRLPKKKTNLILDAGCGRGGTADFVQRRGWGSVIGFDTDAESIHLAQAAYPNARFFVSDVARVSAIIRERFDVIYLLTSFYAFPDQQAALRELRKAAAPDCTLALFDYLDVRGDFSDNEASIRFRHWKPIRLPEIQAMLRHAKWAFDSHLDVTHYFLTWYAELVTRVQHKREEITKAFGPSWFQFVNQYYADVLHLIEQGGLGGIIVYAISGT